MVDIVSSKVNYYYNRQLIACVSITNHLKQISIRHVAIREREQTAAYNRGVNRLLISELISILVML